MLKSNYQTFEQKYYIEHTLWERNFDVEKIDKFENIKYGDIILLHFDLIYSIFKTKTTRNKVEKTIIFDVINVCLRMYQKIKQIYPYNKVYVIIHTDELSLKRLLIDSNVLQALVDIIPDFALVTDNKDPDLEYYNSNNYKHILYGKCSGLKQIYQPENYQVWLILNGKLYITK